MRKPNVLNIIAQDQKSIEKIMVILNNLNVKLRSPCKYFVSFMNFNFHSEFTVKFHTRTPKVMIKKVSWVIENAWSHTFNLKEMNVVFSEENETYKVRLTVGTKNDVAVCNNTKLWRN